MIVMDSSGESAQSKSYGTKPEPGMRLANVARTRWRAEEVEDLVDQGVSCILILMSFK